MGKFFWAPGMRGAAAAVLYLAGLAWPAFASAAPAVEPRVMMQLGLETPLALNLVESEIDIINNFNVSPPACTRLASSGSVKTLSVTQPATDEYVSKLDVYFDAACKKPYFEADIKVKVNVTSATLSFTETGTYFRPNGKVLGKLTSSNRFSAGTALDTIVSLGKFAPVGGQAVADLGFICGIPASGTSLSINCQSGVAQTFKSLKLSIASLVPFTLTAASNATAPKVTFKGTASDVRTGPEGSLTITAPSQGELGIGGGGTVYTSTALSGSEGKFALFPAAPTSLSVTDTKGEAKFAYTVLNKTTRAADSTVEGITSRKRLATSATDATGTGTVKYSDGTSAAIRGFLAAD